MRKYILIVALVFISVSGLFSQESPEVLYKKANDYYQKKDFTKAIENYKKIVNSGVLSAEVFYNLGNSYYRLRHIPESIYFLEIAKKLNPDDQDIDYNLRIANMRVLDKFEQVPQFFITKWFSDLTSSFSSGQWALFAVICSWITFIGLIVFLFIWNPGFKKALFFLSLLFVLITSLSVYFANKQYWNEQSTDTAIIFSESVYVKSSPDDKSTDLFILHEGTKVKIVDYVGNWFKVVLMNGNTGWMLKESVKQISLNNSFL